MAEPSELPNKPVGQDPREKGPQGRYIKLDDRLGSGAYKDVWRAYDTNEGREVAWNVVKLNRIPPGERKRIKTEVKLLKDIEHKNVIKYYNSWVDREKEQIIFITEIMSHGSLKDYLRKNSIIRWNALKRWCRQILRGLEFLHGKQIIHRDIKCDNIFINGSTGDVRIGDLGLSTRISEERALQNGVISDKTREITAASMTCLGTPEFMAPEIYEESYGEKVDIYAFGMMVLEMVTGLMPYHECTSTAQIYKKVLSGLLPPELQLLANLNGRCSDLVKSCLQHQSKRPSATELLTHEFFHKNELEDFQEVRVKISDENYRKNSITDDDDGDDDDDEKGDNRDYEYSNMYNNNNHNNNEINRNNARLDSLSIPINALNGHETYPPQLDPPLPLAATAAAATAESSQSSLSSSSRLSVALADSKQDKPSRPNSARVSSLIDTTGINNTTTTESSSSSSSSSSNHRVDETYSADSKIYFPKRSVENITEIDEHNAISPSSLLLPSVVKESVTNLAVAVPTGVSMNMNINNNNEYICENESNNIDHDNTNTNNNNNNNNSNTNNNDTDESVAMRNMGFRQLSLSKDSNNSHNSDNDSGIESFAVLSSSQEIKRGSSTRVKSRIVQLISPETVRYTNNNNNNNNNSNNSNSNSNQLIHTGNHHHHNDDNSTDSSGMDLNRLLMNEFSTSSSTNNSNNNISNNNTTNNNNNNNNHTSVVLNDHSHESETVQSTRELLLTTSNSSSSSSMISKTTTAYTKPAEVFITDILTVPPSSSSSSSSSTNGLKYDSSNIIKLYLRVSVTQKELIEIDVEFDFDLNTDETVDVATEMRECEDLAMVDIDKNTIIDAVGTIVETARKYMKNDSNMTIVNENLSHLSLAELVILDIMSTNAYADKRCFEPLKSKEEAINKTLYSIRRRASVTSPSMDDKERNLRNTTRERLVHSHHHHHHNTSSSSSPSSLNHFVPPISSSSSSSSIIALDSSNNTSNNNNTSNGSIIIDNHISNEKKHLIDDDIDNYRVLPIDMADGDDEKDSEYQEMVLKMQEVISKIEKDFSQKITNLMLQKEKVDDSYKKESEKFLLRKDDLDKQLESLMDKSKERMNIFDSKKSEIELKLFMALQIHQPSIVLEVLEKEEEKDEEEQVVVDDGELRRDKDCLDDGDTVYSNNEISHIHDDYTILLPISSMDYTTATDNHHHSNMVTAATDGHHHSNMVNTTAIMDFSSYPIYNPYNFSYPNSPNHCDVEVALVSSSSSSSSSATKTATTANTSFPVSFFSKDDKLITSSSSSSSLQDNKILKGSSPLDAVKL